MDVTDPNWWLSAGGWLVAAGLVIRFLASGGPTKNEEPFRLAEFMKAMQAVSWKGDKSDIEMVALVRNAAAALAQYELNYYYRRRNDSNRRSAVFRIFAWGAGTCGVLFPLIASTFESARHLKDYGYIALAAAGAALLANELFAGTTGHIRFVTTQLAMEKRMAQFTLDWEAWRAAAAAKTSDPSKAVGEGLSITKTFLADVHALVEEETKAWAQTLSKAIDTLSASASPKPK